MAKIQTELSINTKALSDKLRAVAPGEFIAYPALSALVGSDVTGQARHSLESARRVLLREGVRFDVKRGEGLQRMTDSEIARSGSRGVRLVHMAAKREARKVAAVASFDSLTNEEKIEHNATLSVLGAVAHFSRPQQVKILEAAVAQTKEKLPVAGAVDAIRQALIPKK